MDTRMVWYTYSPHMSSEMISLQLMNGNVHFSTLKRKAPGYSEMLVPIYQTTLHHIPDHHNLGNVQTVMCHQHSADVTEVIIQSAVEILKRHNISV
jgi:hypothetical protein